MKNFGINAILLRQEDGTGGTGVPPIDLPQYDFDIEKVKAAGFIPKDELESHTKTFAKKLKDTETSGYKKLGEILDSVANEVTTLTGIERAEIEKEGKKEREQLSDYIKRVLSTKSAEPVEKEKQLRDIFSKKEQSLLTETQNLQQTIVSLRYESELQGATSKIFNGITDENELSNSKRIVSAVMTSEYSNKAFDNELNRFVYKDSKGEILYNTKTAEPLSTADILAEVAKLIPAKQVTPRGVGVTPQTKTTAYTKQDIHKSLANEGLIPGSREYQAKFNALLKNIT